MYGSKVFRIVFGYKRGEIIYVHVACIEEESNSIKFVLIVAATWLAFLLGVHEVPSWKSWPRDQLLCLGFL